MSRFSVLEKPKLPTPLKLAIALVISLLAAMPVCASKAPISDPRGQKQAIYEALVRHFTSAELPIAYQIVKCESQFRQYDEKGEVLRGIKVKEDRGAFQVNESYHLVDSVKLGYDIYTIDGNVAMAKHLYDTFGWQPWSASRSCWE